MWIRSRATYLATSRTDEVLAIGQSNTSALPDGYHLAFAIGAGLVAATLVVAASVPGPEARTEGRLTMPAP